MFKKGGWLNTVNDEPSGVFKQVTQSVKKSGKLLKFTLKSKNLTGKIVIQNRNEVGGIC